MRMDGPEKVIGGLYLFQQAFAVHRQQLRFGMDVEYLLQFRAAKPSVYGGAINEPCPVAFLVVESIGYPYPSRSVFTGS